jgi:hypothetical protein
METNDPVVEWRARWNAVAPLPAQPQQPARAQSLWLVALAAFAGTCVALIGCVVLAVSGILVLAANNGAFDETPQSLTYHNDTNADVWVYECIDRCDEYAGWFWMQPGEESSFGLDWYWDGEVDWIIVIREDSTYGCIELAEWKDQTVNISANTGCPSDIHSPNSNVM